MGNRVLDATGLQQELVRHDWVQRKMVNEDTKVHVAFYTRLNNIQKAADDLDLLARDPSPVIGEDTVSDMDCDEAEHVENEFLRGTSVCRKKIDQVLAAIGKRLKEILMEQIAIQVQLMTADPRADHEPNWDGVMDCLDDLIGGDAHEYLNEDVFYKFLRVCCLTWTQAVIDLLKVTAECLPESIIRALKAAVDDYADNYWLAGGLKVRDVQRLCGDQSKVAKVLQLHALTSEFLVQTIATNAVKSASAIAELENADLDETDSPRTGSPRTPGSGRARKAAGLDEFAAESQLALSVLVRRPDYMTAVQSAVACDGITLAMFLPPPSQIRIRSTPAAMITPTAEHSGYLWKEGDSKAAGWKKRFFVLWRHPDKGAEGDYFLLWYENEESTRPKSAFRLQIGTVQISHPKSKRKDHPNAFRLDVRKSGAILNDEDEDEADDEVSIDDPNRRKGGTPRAGNEGDGGTVKRILAADKYEDMVEWMKALEDFTADPEEVIARRAEEDRLREEELAEEQQERDELEAAKQRRQDALEEHEQELATQAEAEAVARERAAFNRQQAEDLARKRTQEAAVEKAMVEQQKAEAKMKQEEAAELMAALSMEKAKLAEEAMEADELEKRGKKKKAEKDISERQREIKEKYEQAQRDIEAAKADELEAQAAAEKAAGLLAERMQFEKEQEEENERRAQEALVEKSRLAMEQQVCATVDQPRPAYGVSD